MRTYRQLLALQVLFTEEKVISIEIDSHFATTDEQLARIWIAELNNEDRLRVVYYIFAEYCVADCL
jgi:hypothetical protein